MKKYKVGLKKLIKQYPNRTDFKPTIWNKLKYRYVVYNTDYENCFMEQHVRLPTLVFALPFLIVINILWNGLSVIPDIIGDIPRYFKPTRIDDMRYDEYEKLI